MFRIAALHMLASTTAPSTPVTRSMFGMRFYSIFNTCVSLSNGLGANSTLSVSPHRLSQVRLMNRNARRPKRANHGKRPVSHARKREKMKSLKSRLYREKVFGFW